jgi:L-ribulose-5-phosphate 3-epimerase
MYFGYNTNGFAHHRLEDVLEILAELGYEGVAITFDHHALNPYAGDLPQKLSQVRDLLERLHLRCVVETGARFLLDPWHKHQPTLLSAEEEQRRQRFDFLRRAVDIAKGIGAEAVGFWSGTPEDDAPAAVQMSRLREACLRLCDHAASAAVRLAFEPEPGMFIDTMARFAELQDQVAHPAFGLTVDIGHLHCLGETPIANHLRHWQALLWNIHIEDMRQGVHDHLMFGEGEIDFAPVLRTLLEIGYRGGVFVELSRHSHDAVNTARHSLEFLKSLSRDVNSPAP